MRHTTFSATSDADGNLVNISTTGDTVIVDVHSRSGIGAATVDLVSGTAPAQISVRLHLHGLEAFRLSYDHTVIAVAVSSDEHHSVSQQVELPDGGTRAIPSDSPLWLDLEMVSAQDSSTPSLQPSVFTIHMPPGLMNEQRRSFTIRWIDFYR